ncbi:hypothetical protein FHG87_005272 [Trinorchestia longiramus]|nr:hypothetical protein FHG87_005272 [Trinorchestia longiramus]
MGERVAASIRLVTRLAGKRAAMERGAPEPQNPRGRFRSCLAHRGGVFPPQRDPDIGIRVQGCEDQQPHGGEGAASATEGQPRLPQGASSECEHPLVTRRVSGFSTPHPLVDHRAGLPAGAGYPPHYHTNTLAAGLLQATPSSELSVAGTRPRSSSSSVATSNGKDLRKNQLMKPPGRCTPTAVPMVIHQTVTEEGICRKGETGTVLLLNLSYQATKLFDSVVREAPCLDYSILYSNDRLTLQL